MAHQGEGRKGWKVYDIVLNLDFIGPLQNNTLQNKLVNHALFSNIKIQLIIDQQKK